MAACSGALPALPKLARDGSPASSGTRCCCSGSREWGLDSRPSRRNALLHAPLPLPAWLLSGVQPRRERFLPFADRFLRQWAAKCRLVLPLLSDRGHAAPACGRFATVHQATSRNFVVQRPPPPPAQYRPCCPTPPLDFRWRGGGFRA